jgi:preprotein translocase subunit SecF
MNIVGRRSWYFIIAALLALISIVALAVFQLKPGLDFASGSLMTIHFDQPVTQEALRQELDTLNYQEATIQQDSSGDYIIHTLELTDAAKTQLISDLVAKFGTIGSTGAPLSYDKVEKGDAVTAVRNATIAIIVSVGFMLLYIAFAFRKMPSPFRYGVCAVAGLAFDVLIALGAFAILGKFLGWEVDLMFIAGILAVLGFSINNTIIVFDRIRENTARGVSPDIEVVANFSIVQTLGRSFNTCLTVLFTLFVLSLFVGSSIQNFVTVLIIGTISGVFTSTCLSPEMLVAWQKKGVPSVPGRINVAAAKVKS